MDTRFSDSLQWVDWCSKIPGYSKMTKNQKKKAKKRYKMNECSLVDCCVVSTEPTPCAYNKKETAMDTTTIYDIEDEKRSYLRNRLTDIRYQKASKLEKEFGLLDDDAPKTPQEYVDRIKSGMVTFPTDEEFIKNNANMSFNGWCALKPGSTLRWRDPAVKEDRDGYHKAMTAFEATETPVYDAIAIEDPKDALDAVQAHEQATLH